MLTKNCTKGEFRLVNEHMIMLFSFEHMIQITDDLRIESYDFVVMRKIPLTRLGWRARMFSR